MLKMLVATVTRNARNDEFMTHIFPVNQETLLNYPSNYLSMMRYRNNFPSFTEL